MTEGPPTEPGSAAAPPQYAPQFPAQYPPYPQYSAPGWVPRREPTSTMAIIALVLAILPLVITWPVAFILAIATISRNRQGLAKGMGLAIAALVISLLWMAVSAVGIVIVGTSLAKHINARDNGSGSIFVDQLRTGDCIVAFPPGDAPIDTIDIIACTKPHRDEVFATFTVNPGSNPTQALIDRLAEGGCYKRFRAYVGSDPDHTNLYYSWIDPALDALDTDKQVSCVVAEPDEARTTGSLRNSNR